MLKIGHLYTCIPARLTLSAYSIDKQQYFDEVVFSKNRSLFLLLGAKSESGFCWYNFLYKSNIFSVPFYIEHPYFDDKIKGHAGFLSHFIEVP